MKVRYLVGLISCRFSLRNVAVSVLFIPSQSFSAKLCQFGLEQKLNKLASTLRSPSLSCPSAPSAPCLHSPGRAPSTSAGFLALGECHEISWQQDCSSCITRYQHITQHGTNLKWTNFPDRFQVSSFNCFPYCLH